MIWLTKIRIHSPFLQISPVLFSQNNSEIVPQARYFLSNLNPYCCTEGAPRRLLEENSSLCDVVDYILPSEQGSFSSQYVDLRSWKFLVEATNIRREGSFRLGPHRSWKCWKLFNFIIRPCSYSLWYWALSFSHENAVEERLLESLMYHCVRMQFVWYSSYDSSRNGCSR